MNSYRKKIKKSDLNFIDVNDFEPHIETNILIREEAEFLAKNFKEDHVKEFDEALEHDVVPTLANIEDQNKANKEKLAKIDDGLKESFNELKETLENSLPNKNDFSNFQDSMNSTIYKLNEIADLLKFNATNTKNDSNCEKNYSNNNQQNYYQNQPLFDPTIQYNQVDPEKELFESFEKLIDLKVSDSESKIQDVVSELDSTKQKFHDLLSSYENALKSVTTRQDDLNTYLYSSHSTIDVLSRELNATKENYQRIEDEISKVYMTWTENNKLLNKLESLVFDVGNARLGYEEDLNTLLDELKDKTINNQTSLNQLNIEVENIKDKIDIMNKNHDDLVAMHHEAIEKIRDDIDSEIKNVKDGFDEEVVNIKDQINSNEIDINNLKENSFTTIERIVGIEQQVFKNTSDIEAINVKIDEISNLDRTLDFILAAPIFQKSLEMKISNMIVENNNYIGDEFKAKLENFSTNVISDIDDVRRSNEELIETYQNIENRLLEISNAVNSIDTSAEIHSQLEYIESNYQELYEKTAERIRENLLLIDTQLQSLKVDESEVINLINSSYELSEIIKDKTRQVVEEKVNDVRHEIDQIQFNLEHKIKDFNQKMLARAVNEKIEFETSKIRNESLNIIYNELIERDKRIDFNNEELIKNYETILECNRILDNLECLVIKQGEELDGYKFDRNNSIALLADKISEQKRKLSEIEESVKANISKFNFYEESESGDALKRGLESWKLEFSADMVQMVKNLVADEIKKKNIISYVNNENNTTEINENLDNNEFNPFAQETINENQSSENSFFINRVKDILSRLENSDLQKTFEEKFNLNVNLSELEQENPNEESDDLNWFYEKEYNEYVSQKKKNN